MDRDERRKCIQFERRYILIECQIPRVFSELNLTPKVTYQSPSDCSPSQLTASLFLSLNKHRVCVRLANEARVECNKQLIGELECEYIGCLQLCFVQRAQEQLN